MKRATISLTVEGPVTKKVKTEPSEVTPVRPVLEASSLRGHHPFKDPADKIALIVGEGKAQRSFFVHKDILCRQSRFFQLACSAEWKKPEDQCIKLPGDDPEVIQAMVHWMYEEMICIPQTSIDHGLDWYKINNDNVMGTAWGLLVKLFLLGEKFQIEALQYDAIKSFVYLWNVDCYELEPKRKFARFEAMRIAMHVASYIYNRTRSSESPLRRMLLCLIVADLSDSVDIDYLSFLKEQVSPLAFTDITYELAKLHRDMVTGVQYEEGWLDFNVGMVAPPGPDFITRLHPSYKAVEDPTEKPYFDHNISQN